METNHIITNTESKPTMKDVARESGYSLATVSKVINGLPTGEKSRSAVEEAIRKLGYQVNPYARALKSNRTFNVIIVMPSLKIPFFAHLTDALIEALTKIGYTHQLMITSYDPDAKQKSFSMVHANKADGIIALTYAPDLIIEESIPIVAIDRHLGKTIPCISSDNYHGGELAAEKLLDLGCRRLLFLRISSGIPGEPDKRREGFESICRKRNIPFHSILLHTEETEQPFYAFLKEHICDGKMEFDGIFCNSDSLACKVQRFLEAHGVRIPEEVQIIGYDGLIDHFTDRYVCSTIEQPIRQMAEGAVSLLLNSDHTSLGKTIILPVRYIPAGTTKDS